MKQAGRSPRATWVLLVLLAAASPALANIDFVCPLCEPEPLTVAGLVDLALSTVVEKGLSLLVLGAVAVVGLPWLVAAAAVAAFQLPGRFRR